LLIKEQKDQMEAAHAPLIEIARLTNQSIENAIALVAAKHAQDYLEELKREGAKQ